MANEPIRIPEMRAFVNALRKATEDKTGEKAVKAANVKTGDFVIRMAQREATTKMERKSAATLTASKAMTAVRVALGGQDVPYYAGANFGAHRNVTRLIKAKAVRDIGGGMINQKRTRATMVRKGESVEKVVRRVERQYVDTKGRTLSRRQGGQQVRIARTKTGRVRMRKGWNQFRKWEKGKDYFLYAAIRRNYDEIVEFYFAALGDAVNEVFPDHTGE
jgi:hypothetical protein